jgi:hypothetical protein
MHHDCGEKVRESSGVTKGTLANDARTSCSIYALAQLRLNAEHDLENVSPRLGIHSFGT